MIIIKGIFVICQWPYFFCMKYEMDSIFLEDGDFAISRDFPKQFSVKCKINDHLVVNRDFDYVLLFPTPIITKNTMLRERDRPIFAPLELVFAQSLVERGFLMARRIQSGQMVKMSYKSVLWT